MKDKLDILKEIGNISAAHGSTALAEILGRKINLRVPSMDIVPCVDLPKTINAEGTVISLQTNILTGLRGKVFFILDEKSTYQLVDLCYKPTGEIKKGSLFTEMSLSLIKEIGSVVISSYIYSLGYYLRKLIIPSLPILINAPFTEVIKLAIGDVKDDYILAIESIFEEPQANLKGNFWLLLSHEAAEDIQNACETYLDDLEK